MFNRKRLVFVREELFVIFNTSFIIDWLEISVFVELEEGISFIFDAIDEEDTVEMVNFVSKSASEFIGSFNAYLSAIFEFSFDANFRVAWDLTINKWNRKTAFEIFDNFTFLFDDFWVDKGSEGSICFVIHTVADNNQALVNAELRGSHSGRELVGVRFFPFEAGIDHCLDHIFNFIGNIVDLLRLLTKSWVRRFNNFHILIL